MNTSDLVVQMNELLFQTELDDINRVNVEVNGFSGPYIMKALNMAISNMVDKEYYLEIGTHQGKTLIGGMIGNTDKAAVAVDNFSKFDDDKGTRDRLYKNIERFGLGEQIRFFEMDSDVFFETEAPLLEGKIGVYFYDGDHNTDAGYRGLCNAVPYLSDEAVIILDDFSSHGVWLSVFQFLERYQRETALLFVMRTNNFPFPHKMWWNGIVVISWKKDRSMATGN